ncbi:MAG: class I SAM-dependent RNA methyltransferase [Acidobacteriota bacterium]
MTTKKEEFIFQATGRYFAQTQKGLSDIAALELEELGAEDCKVSYNGVYFTADAEVLYRINYMIKTVSRILAPLVSFTVHNEKELYKKCYKIEWERFMSPEKTFSISSSVSGSRINHSKFAALRVKDAIADRLREKFDTRPNVDTTDPDIPINLNIRNNFCTISFDTSGQSLHKRGYRVNAVSAPLHETLAAAIIRISGWDGSVPLYDPMSGSGTLLGEALLKYGNRPSSVKKRSFGVFNLPGFNRNLWRDVKQNCDNGTREIPEGLISGSDIDKINVRAARQNMNEVQGGENIKITRSDFREIEAINDSMIISNLPYGHRLGNVEEAGKLYTEFGNFLKHKCRGSKAFLLCGSTELVKKIGLRTSRKIPLFNGPIETRLIELDLY